MDRLEESFLADFAKVLESKVDSPSPEVLPRSCRSDPGPGPQPLLELIASHTAASLAEFTYIAARSVPVTGFGFKS